MTYPKLLKYAAGKTVLLFPKKKTFSKNNEPFIFMTSSEQENSVFRFFYAYIRSHLTYVTLKRLRKKVTLNFTAQLKEVQKSYSYLIIETNVRFYRAVISLRDDNLSLLLHVFKCDKMSCTSFEYLIFIGRNFCRMTTIWFSFFPLVSIFNFGNLFESNLMLIFCPAKSAIIVSKQHIFCLWSLTVNFKTNEWTLERVWSRTRINARTQ